jgi:hypothetical protein
MTYGNYNEISTNRAEILEISQQNTHDLYTKKFCRARYPQINCPNCPNVSVEHGLDFMLGHFEEPLFPRNVSTAATRGAQKPVYDKDRAILFYQGALRQDCRLAVYPNYEVMAEKGLLTSGYRPKPSHLFIDLDLTTFANDQHKLDLALKGTLRNISRELGGAMPTVIWSGGGYHIHQPLDAAVVPAFEDMSEFKRFKDPSIKFLRYTERQLTNGKADRNHCISFKSCMARPPGSRNSKYNTDSDAAEVRIVQSWNGIRAKPTKQFLVTDFLIWLVQDELNTKIRLHEQAQKWARRQRGEQQPFTSKPVTDTAIRWIDKLLQTAIEDYRKHAVALILAPYLLTIKRMSSDQAYNTIGHWLSTCNSVRRLEPAGSQFMRIVVKPAIDRTMQKSVRPMKWVTLQNKNPGLYELLLKEMDKKI